MKKTELEDQPRLFSLSEVANVLHCSKEQVLRLTSGNVCDAPPLPSIRLGRSRSSESEGER